MTGYNGFRLSLQVIESEWSAYPCICYGGESRGQETSLIHQDQSIKPQTDSVKEENNYLCHNNITQQKHYTVLDT